MSTVAVGIKELKNRLSAYLREVQRGQRIVVTDRGRVVAEIHAATDAPTAEEETLHTWEERGALRPPVASKRRLPKTSARTPAGTARAILDELRGESPSER